MKPKLALLTDFGSTYTKVCAVDVDTGRLYGRAQFPTTMDSDIAQGWREAVEHLRQKEGVDLSTVSAQLACSSAGGGLRMVTVGFVPRYTSKAGQMAALGAGAKVVGSYSYRLAEAQITEIRNLSPDILLLCGGTDGGDADTVLANAQKLAVLGPDCVTVFAGNQDVRDEIARLFSQTDKRLRLTENVMPEIGDVNTQGVTNLVRELFAEHVIKAKGIDRVQELTGNIVMPTPAAVYAGLELLSSGAEGSDGLGELIAVDVGGATTDVYSFSHGSPTRANVILRSLREPYGKRTVEGDIGVRLNAPHLVNTAEAEELLGQMTHHDNFRTLAEPLPSHRSWLPSTEEEWSFDASLAAVAIAVAVRRHAGRLSEIYTVEGARLIQDSKDLSEVGTCIGIGGPLVYSRDGIRTL
ncbi:glutamate mutase L, partial [Chloroflexota bacterium]